VRELVIGLSVMHTHTSGQCSTFDYGAFWGHSLATAIACQELAQFAQISSEELFTIGLLARVGELAMASLYPEEYAVILLKAKEGDASLATLERDCLEMDHQQLGATMLAEWGLPELLIQAAYHHEQPDLAGFRDGSRVQTLTHSLHFARALAEVCMADEEARWSLLPGLLTRAARLGISGDALNDMADRMSAAGASGAPCCRCGRRKCPRSPRYSLPAHPAGGSARPTRNRTARLASPRLHVQVVGIPVAELPTLMQQIESLGHQPVLVDSTSKDLKQVLREPAQIVIADMAMPGLKPAVFCRILRQTTGGQGKLRAAAGLAGQ
jgi:two-component system cell cycle response regulator